MPIKKHTSSDLRYTAKILGADNATVLAPRVAVGVEFLSGRRLEHAQLIASETSHMIVLRSLDARQLTDAGYFDVSGVLYVVDYLPPALSERPDQWTEVYCHVSRSGR